MNEIMKHAKRAEELLNADLTVKGKRIRKLEVENKQLKEMLDGGNIITPDIISCLKADKAEIDELNRENK